MPGNTFRGLGSWSGSWSTILRATAGKQTVSNVKEKKELEECVKGIELSPLPPKLWPIIALGVMSNS